MIVIASKALAKRARRKVDMASPCLYHLKDFIISGF